AFELDAAADLEDVPLGEAAIDAADPRRGRRVRRDLRPGGVLQAGVAAGVVGVLVGVEDLRDLPAALARRLQAQPPLEGIDRERLAGLRAGDEIVEVCCTRRAAASDSSASRSTVYTCAHSIARIAVW